MIRNTYVGMLLVLIMALAACGGGATDTASTMAASFSDPALTRSVKLAAGTLMLEETPHTVTPAQAQELLPLWQMLRALQESGTASQLETEAVLNQIQAMMTPDQLAAIEEMSPEDMRALLQEFGMRATRGQDDSESTEVGGSPPPDMVIMAAPGMGPGMGPMGDVSPEEQATAIAEQTSSVSGTALTDGVIEFLQTLIAPSEVAAENPATDTTGISEATPTPLSPTSTPTPATMPPTDTPTVTAAQMPQPATATAMPAPTPELDARFVFQVATGGDIYTVNADGSNLTRLTTGMDPSWSPDGSQITFVRWTTPWGIYIINAGGSNESLLFSSNVARAPVWSPDGSQIAFHFETEGWTAPVKADIPGLGYKVIRPPQLQTEWHLGVVDVADGYLRQPHNDRFSFSPSWSPDGEWIVYDGGDDGELPTNHHGLCMTTVEGPNNSVLTENANDHFPVWSPDGTRIAFMHWQHDHWEIYIMNADGSGRWALTSSSAYVEPRPNNVAPAWSPDGEQIVFLSDRDGKWESYVMNADGSDQRQILGNVTDQLDIQYNGSYERVISWGPM